MAHCQCPQKRHRDRSCQRPATHILRFQGYQHGVWCPQWHVQAQERPHPQELHYCLWHATRIVAHLNALFPPKPQEG